MIKAIFFDLDGVLFIAPAFVSEFAKKANIDPLEISKFFSESFNLCLRGKADLKIELGKKLTKWKWHQGVDAFLNDWFRTEDILNKEVISYIKNLKKQRPDIRFIIVSNQEKYRAKYIKMKNEVNLLFDSLFFSCDLGYTKNDTEFFKKVLANNSNIRADEILYWDDSESNVKTALKVGIKANLYTNFLDLKKITSNLI